MEVPNAQRSERRRQNEAALSLNHPPTPTYPRGGQKAEYPKGEPAKVNRPSGGNPLSTTHIGKQ
jgi:hypothetical protein